MDSLFFLTFCFHYDQFFNLLTKVSTFRLDFFVINSMILYDHHCAIIIFNVTDNAVKERLIG
jgi:hypothetical protein